MVSVVEAVPIGVLIGVVFACRLRRRFRFWLRFAGVVIATVLPVLAMFAAALLAHIGEQTAGPMLVSGLPWGIVLVPLSRFVLFHGPSFDPQSTDEDDQGPGPGNGRPTPPAPTGGILLLDAGPSSTRVRDHRLPQQGLQPRRPVRERERLPLRMWPLRLWP